MSPQRTAALVSLLLAACTPRAGILPEREDESAREKPRPREAKDAAQVVAKVRAIYQELRDAKLPSRLYVLPVDADPPAWRSVTEAEAEALRADPDTPNMDGARVFGPPGHVRRVLLTLTSQSGDWVSNIEYDFYPSGRLAFLFDEHRTYHAGSDEAPPPYVCEERRYFAEDGREVRTLARVYRLETKREVSQQPLDHLPAPVWRDVSELPFR